MSWERVAEAAWLQWSGLPAVLNGVRQGGWMVFWILVEEECRRNRQPGAFEISLAELATRAGLDTEKALKILEALRRKKYLKFFAPDHDEEPMLIEIQTPLVTPCSAEEVAKIIPDPSLRNPHAYRYTAAPAEDEAQTRDFQTVLDWYLDRVSQHVNSMVLEQIQLAVRRFPIEKIESTMERATRYEVRSMQWVIKELIREDRKKDK